MELELKKSCLDAYEVSNGITLTQEETAETIVPDYCPDIARIVKTDGKVYLHNRELRDGKALLNGTVRVSVLYTPDGEKGLRTLELAIPFSAESERGSLTQCRHLIAQTEIGSLETRMLNPRKVFTRCKLITRITGFQNTQFSFCTDVEASSTACVEKRQEQQHAVFMTHIAEKDFTFSDDIMLSPGREGAAELLSSRIQSTVTDTKTVGNKLVFKGAFQVSFLYRTTNGACATGDAELPFSQVMEVDGAPEDACAEVRMQLTGADLQISSDDPEGRQVSITLYLHATAFLYQEQNLLLLEDLYSTAFQTAYEAAPLNLTAYRESMIRRQTMREVLEIGVVAESILALTADCGNVSVGREGQNSVLRATVNIRALYLDEGGSALVAERSVESSCQLELPEGCSVSAEAICTGEIQSSIGDRGIEVRFPVDFSIQMESKVKRVCISAAKIDTETPKDTASAPSLVLRCLKKQESAWDLAKKYHTTIAAILTANQLENEGDIPRDRLLLIPKKRA